MKTYKFIYEDQKGNELKSELLQFRNIKEAKKVSYIVYANSLLNDLHKIRVKLQ
jgi:hypothetical protein